MSEVVVVGSFKAEPGKEAEALEAFKDAGRADARRGRLHPVRAPSGRRRSVAASRSSSAGRPARQLNAHLQAPHVAAILERAPELFGESGTITVYDAVPGGEDRSKGALAAASPT